MRAGAYLYLLRPNAETWARLQGELSENIPCDFDPRRAIAMPIRGSDKCRGPLNANSAGRYKNGELWVVLWFEEM
jgi:hypothetical protein